MNKHNHVLFLIILTFLLAACATADTTKTLEVTITPIKFFTTSTPRWKEVDDHKFILEQEECQLPCFKNIIPGKTTVEEVYKILPGGKYSRRGKMIEDGREISIYAYRFQSGITPEIICLDNVVEMIVFTTSISLNTFVINLGEPTLMAVPLFIPEERVDVINLFYPEKGIRIEAVGNKKVSVNFVQIYPAMTAHLVTLHQPLLTNDPQEILDKWLWYYDNYFIQEYHLTFPWQGYGDYEVK